MPRTRSSFVKLRIDGTGYLKKVDAAARKIFYEAAALFLRAAVPKIPVYTGMSRGSLVPLANFLKSKGVKTSISIPISPSKDRLAKYLILKGQNEQAGKARSDFSFEDVGGRFKFVFNASVEHYKFNDRQASRLPGVTSAPWHSFDAGAEAANEYIAKNLKTIPRIKVQGFNSTIGRSRRTF